MTAHDAIVLGTGGVGSAAAFHLARRGLKVLGLDRFGSAHDKGSSHGQTRIIRKAYFEHPDYVPLLERAYASWSELEGLRRESRGAGRLFHRTGLLQIGPPRGSAVSGALESARRHRLAVERLDPREVRRRFPGFRVPEGSEGVFEEDAGYLRVEECVRAHLEQAARCGADLRTNVAVESWSARGNRVKVLTDGGTFETERLVIAAGPWAGSLLGGLGHVLEVRKKPIYWFGSHSTEYRASSGCPCFLYELREGVFYGIPAVDDRGVKAARHTGGTVVSDPTNVDRGVDAADQAAVDRFVADILPGVERPFTAHAVCMYTMSPDEHFIVDRHPEHENVVYAAGLSGHGFKFTGVLGEALADLVTKGSTLLPIDFLSAGRAALRTGPH